MAATALFALRINVRNLDRATQFYLSLGMVEDIGMRLAGNDGAPTVIAAGNSGLRSVALRWPHDPYMHLVLAESAETPEAVWPVDVDQLGPTTISLLVADIEAEIAGAEARGGRLVQPLADTQRLLGKSRAALVADPDGNPVELISIETEPGWDNSGCRVGPDDRTFLHFQLNAERYADVRDFYAGFGFEHNALNDTRPGWTLPGAGPEQFIEAFEFDIMEAIGEISFFRLPSDHSQMHLEIMGWQPAKLVEPIRPSTFRQRGIMRTCFKTKDVEGVLDDLRRRGAPILTHHQRAGLVWGDSEWLWFRDPDGLISTFEEWFPAGQWGERC